MQTERDSTASVDEENASEEGLLREYRAEISRLQGELNLAREKRESGKLLNHQDKAKGPSYVPEEMVAEWEKRYPFILVTDFFQLGKLKSSIYAEVFSGIIQFISCLYCLPVIPEQLKYAGYNEERGTVVISLACMLGCLLLGCWTNLPFCVAPPTAVSIYFSVAVQDRNLKASEGSTAVMLSGILLLFFIHKPFLRFSVRLIPNCVQVGTAIGIGLLTALAGATEVGLVKPGKHTIVSMGEMTDLVVFATGGMLLLASLLHYNRKGAFCTALCVVAVLWWIWSGDWPTEWYRLPAPLPYGAAWEHAFSLPVLWLALNLLFLYMFTLSGVVVSLADIAGGSIQKKGEVLDVQGASACLVTCGLMTLFSGLLGGPPILISPESAGGIKAGARSGLSTVVCGLFFGFSALFAPFFQEIPEPATTPLVIFVGFMLFDNVKRMNWTTIRDAFPAFIVLFLIPFSYNVLGGVIFGFGCWVVLSFTTTGEAAVGTRNIFSMYAPQMVRQCGMAA